MFKERVKFNKYPNQNAYLFRFFANDGVKLEVSDKTFAIEIGVGYIIVQLYRSSDHVTAYVYVMLHSVLKLVLPLNPGIRHVTICRSA